MYYDAIAITIRISLFYGLFSQLLPVLNAYNATNKINWMKKIHWIWKIEWISFIFHGLWIVG